MNPKSRAIATALALVVGLPTLAYSQRARSRPRSGTAPAAKPATKTDEAASPPEKVVKTDEEWRRQLTPTQYMVARRKATEPAFSGKYAVGHFKGVFTCVGCEADLFSSTHKFNSGTGWPSFYRPLRNDALSRDWDYSNPAETRVEVMCARCDAHLGHVFSDGPPPTGLRFCINSAALKLKPFSAAAKGKVSAKAKGKTAKEEPKADAPDEEPGESNAEPTP